MKRKEKEQKKKYQEFNTQKIEDQKHANIVEQENSEMDKDNAMDEAVVKKESRI